MWTKIISFWFAATVLAIGLAAEPGEAPALLPIPEEGLVVLRNGQLFEGRISRVGDLYYVAVPEGEIRLRAAEVEVVCHDLEEGYQRKRATITVENAYEHLRLALWCQRYKLFDHALEEIATARKIDPHLAAIDTMEHRLRAAMTPEDDSTPAVAPLDNSVSFEDLDRMVRQMPPKSVEAFSQTIQPMLMNNCATSGCHGPQSETNYRLLRAPTHQPASRRLTQRNLYETLKWIDFENPEESRLLKAAAARHGGAKNAVLGDRQSQQRLRLTVWLYEVGLQPVPDAALADNGENRGAALPASNGFNFDPAVKPASHVEPVATNPAKPAAAKGSPVKQALAHEGAAAETGAVVSAVAVEAVEKDEPHPRQIQRGATMPFAPADPFDPEVFNRKYVQPK